MEQVSSISSDLLAREQQLRALNDALDTDVHAVATASAALHESVARAQQAAWTGADLGDDADPMLLPAKSSNIVAPRMKSSMAMRSSVERVTSESISAAAGGLPVGVSRPSAEQDAGQATASRIPSFQSRLPVRAPSSSRPTAVPPTGMEEAITPLHKPQASLSTETEVYIDPDLPLETQVKLLKSHLRVAKHELAEARTVAAGATAEAVESRKQAQAAVEERSRLNRAVQAAESALEKAKRAASSAESREMELKGQLAHLNKQQVKRTEEDKAGAGGSSGTAAMEARLARAQEEVSKLKETLSTERAHQAEHVAALRREVEHLQAEEKRADKQKAGGYIIQSKPHW